MLQKQCQTVENKIAITIIATCISAPIGKPVPAPIWTQAQAYLAESEARARRIPGRLTTFTANTDQEQRNYLRQHYGDAPPRGLGVRQGEYITVGADEVNDERRFLATDFLMDCHALVLVARDSQGKVLRTLLTHTDSMTDVPNVVPQLLARMPQGSRVEATIIGSTQGFNPYLHSALLDALSSAPQVTRIRQNVDLANTVAVDTTTGRILTAAPPSGRIELSEIPIDVQFSPRESLAGVDVREFLYRSYSNQNTTSTMGLTDAWNAAQGFTPFDSVTRYINTLVDSDNGLTPDELQAINTRLNDTLRQQVRLVVGQPTADDARATISVQTLNGAALGSFVSPIIPASLPALHIANTGANSPS